MARHVRRIGGDNRVTKLYAVLVAAGGAWRSTLQIHEATKDLAVHSSVSELRAQLPAEQKIEVKKHKGRFWYRLVVEGAEPAASELALTRSPGSETSFALPQSHRDTEELQEELALTA